MSFNRNISKYLDEWRANPNKKPLVLRGARQVGKTTVVKQFAKKFDTAIFLNLEKAADRKLFDENDEVTAIINRLFLEHQVESKSEILIFIDEIQECPKAIQLLRYFYEEKPELFVIAAGSLLEFSIKAIESFPVGRVEFLYLYPFNFDEYLQALSHKNALEQINQVPINEFAHDSLLKLFHDYAIIGGMPEIIKTFLNNKDVTKLPKVYESIWETYKNDVEKYARNDTAKKVIRHLMNTAPLYMDERIKFQNFGNSNYKSREVSEAFRNLDDAKVIRLIYPSTDLEAPIKPDLKKSPRMQFLDTGIVNYTLGIQAELLTAKDLSNAYRGRLIPHLITQELISLNYANNKKPFFWVREKKQSSAEVDLIVQYKNRVIPIEIKSGKAGKLKSLHQFIDRCEHAYAIRFYGGKFTIEEHFTSGNKKPYLLMNLPYYLGTRLPEYLDWFVENY